MSAEDRSDVPADDLLERLRLSVEQARRDRLVRADLLSPVLRIPDVDSAVVDLDALDAAIDREEC